MTGSGLLLPSGVRSVEEEAGELVGQLGSRFAAGALVYHDDPVGFASDCVRWPRGRKSGLRGGLAEYQEEVARALVEFGRVAVRGPRGLGKTLTAATMILWFALTRDAAEEDWKVIVTAGAWNQLTAFLWPEVRTKMTPYLDWGRIGRSAFVGEKEMMKAGLQLEFGAVTLCAPSDSGKIEGAHADELLYVLDEAKSIPDETWNSLEGGLSGAGGPDEESDQVAYVLASSTPGAPEGRFFDIHEGAEGYEDWHRVHVTLERALAARRITPTWVRQREAQFGADSAWVANHVKGEFARRRADAVIDQDHLEAANERWRDLGLRGVKELLVPVHDSLGPLDTIGADISGRGEDVTVFALRHGNIISTVLWRPQDSDPEEDLFQLAGVPERGARIIIDAIGEGSPIANNLKKRGRKVVDFIASTKTDLRTKGGQLGFSETRDAAWWNLREVLEPGSGFELAIPPDDQLTADLLAPRWEEVAGGKIKVESKKLIRKRLKRSTDGGDAVMQAMFLSRIAPIIAAPRILRRPGGSRNSALRQMAGGGQRAGGGAGGVAGGRRFR